MKGPRLKDLGRWFSGGTPPSNRLDLWDGDVPWLSGKDFDSTRLREPTKFTTDEGATEFSRLMPAARSVLVLVRGMALAHGLPVVRLPFDAAINQDVRGLVVARDFEPGFIYYTLVGRRRALDAHIDRAAHGTARVRDTIYSHRLDYVPDLAAQREIVRFLDRECARIAAASDRLIVAAHALERVGGDWLGDQLRTVSPVRIKLAGISVEQGWSPQAEDRDLLPHEPAVLKLSAVSSGSFEPDLAKALPDADPLLVERYRVHRGDLLMVRASGSLRLLGRACVVDQDPTRPLLFPDIVYRLATTKDQLDLSFLNNVLATPQGRDALESLKRGAANNKLRIEDVRNLSLPIPSAAMIGDLTPHLRALTENTERARVKAKRLGRLLDEYRLALIHEAVTGKLNPRAAGDEEMTERLASAIVSEGEVNGN